MARCLRTTALALFLVQIVALEVSSVSAQGNQVDVLYRYAKSADTVGQAIHWRAESDSALVVELRGGLVSVDLEKRSSNTDLPNVSNGGHTYISRMSHDGSRLVSISTLTGGKSRVRVHNTATWELEYEIYTDSLDMLAPVPGGAVLSSSGDSLILPAMGGLSVFRFSTNQRFTIPITEDSLDYHPAYTTSDGRYLTGMVYDKDKLGRPVYGGSHTFIYDLHSGTLTNLWTVNITPVPESNSQYFWVNDIVKTDADTNIYRVQRVKFSDALIDRDFEVEMPVGSIVLSPTHRWMAINHRGYPINKTTIYSTETGERLFDLWHPPGYQTHRMTAVAFSPDEKYMLATPYDLNAIHLFKIVEDESGVDAYPVAGLNPGTPYLAPNVLSRGDRISLVYPELSGEARLQIADPSGKTITSWTIEGTGSKNPQDIGTLSGDVPNGFYYLLMETKAGNLFFPLIVQD